MYVKRLSKARYLRVRCCVVTNFSEVRLAYIVDILKKMQSTVPTSIGLRCIKYTIGIFLGMLISELSTDKKCGQTP